MGHVPRRGELFEINGLRFQVLLTKAGAVKWFKVFAVQANTVQTPQQTDKAP
jgi:magnesium and cobalt transporter